MNKLKKIVLNRLDEEEIEVEEKEEDEEEVVEKEAGLTLTRGSVKLVHIAISSRVLISG